MRRALACAADAASLVLTVPAAVAALVCTCSSVSSGSGSFGSVGRYSPVSGCLPASDVNSAAAVATAAVGEVRNQRRMELMVTLSEASLMAVFCVLQTGRLAAAAARVRAGGIETVLLLSALATALLLAATASLAVNNPRSLLYSSGPFVLQLPGLAACLLALGLWLTVLVTESDAELQSELAQQQSVAPDNSSATEIAASETNADCGPLFVRQPPQQLMELLPFADEDDRLVYEFRGDGRLEWRLGSDRGGDAGANSGPSTPFGHGEACQTV